MVGPTVHVCVNSLYVVYIMRALLFIFYVNRLPYVEATMLELHRYKTLAPFAMFHATLNDTEVGDYFIPKGTAVCKLY